MLVLSLSFLLGVSQLLWLPTIDLTWLYGCLFVFIICVISLIHTIKYRQLFTFVIVFISGFSYALVVANSHKTHQLQQAPADLIVVKGYVSEIPSVSVSKTKFILQLEDTVEQLPIKKVLINWYDCEQQIKPGQIWQLTLKIKPIHALYNPATFDYSKWLFRNGIDAIATVKKGVLLDESHFSFFTQVNSIRVKIAQVIAENINSSRVISLLTALMIGDKSLITSEDSQLFQKTGTAHLIAISGLHIGLMAFVGLLIGCFIFYVFTSQQHNRYVFETFFSIALAFVYALLAGLSIPTIRALVMVVIFALSYVNKSHISRWNTWSIALFIVLLFDPLSVLDAGFWFSFTAVAVLMFAYTGKAFEKSKVLGFVKAQLVILIGLMPLMVMVFHQFNILTPIANFLVLPLASIVLIPLLFLSLFVYSVSETLAHFVFLAVEKTAELVFYILDYLSQFEFLKIAMPSFSGFYVVILSLSVIILLLPRLFRWKWLVLVLFIPLFLLANNDLNEKEFRINVLDVGQGLSIIVRTKKHTLVYDTGAKYESGFSMAQAVVLPVLQNFGVRKLDRLVLSHADNDHAGGRQDLIAFFNPKVFDVMGEFNNCQYPLSWNWDGVDFEVLSPFELEPYMGNNTSCVIKVSNEINSVLLTADIEEPVEYRLLTQFPLKIKSDVLLVPHHGSLSSSSEDFIKAVNPKFAVNSSGYVNQFHHPHTKVKQRYESLEIPFYDTQSAGMMEVYSDNSEIHVITYLSNNQHFWYSGNL
jgi:competence protein ComEC